MIPKRLRIAGEYINKDDVIVDVGCDHGYLGLIAYERGAKKIIFVDNKEEPLRKSINNTKDLIPNGCCSYILSDGLKEVKESFDKVFILGMGGELISHIIEDSIDKIDKNTILVLDAHTKIPSLRKYLFDNYFLIEEEKILKENSHYYELIVAIKSDNKHLYNDADLLFGPCLIKEKSPVFIEKWSKKLEKDETILKNTPNAKNILEESELIKKILCLK